MRRVLVDSANEIIYSGEDSKEVLKVLLAKPEDVTEEDELKYEHQLRNLGWKGDLRYEVHFTLKFKGFDDFDRPVFKDVDSVIHFGSVNHLRNSKIDVVEYLTQNTQELEYFGEKFNCEPQGGKQPFFKFNIL